MTFSYPIDLKDISKWKCFQQFFTLLIFLGVMVVLNYIYKTVPSIDHAAPLFKFLPKLNFLILCVHIVTAVPPLIIGAIAFRSVVIYKTPRLHRWIGTMYCVCIWISSFTGILLASANTHGIIAQLGFGLLGVLWFFTTWVAYFAARRLEFSKHRRWMIRSYSLTLAVLTVRPLFWYGPPSFMVSADWYLLVTWICWVPNYMAAELYIRCTTASGALRNELFRSKKVET